MLLSTRQLREPRHVEAPLTGTDVAGSMRHARIVSCSAFATICESGVHSAGRKPVLASFALIATALLTLQAATTECLAPWSSSVPTLQP